MAARILMQRRAAPLAASLLAGAVAFSPRVAHAEAPESYKSNSNKKPIYDDFDAVPTTATLPPPKAATQSTTTTPAPETPSSSPLKEVVSYQYNHGPTPTDRLADQVREVRLFLYRHACNAEDAVNRTMDRAFNLEKSFTDTIASLAPPAESGEKLMPGMVYVLVAAMAGSIVTRRSNILLRATVPAAFGVGMASTVLPFTMNNVSELTWKYEQRFPVVAQGHIQAKESLRRGVSFVKVHAKLGQDIVDEKVKGVRETVEEWVRKGK
ncbi:MICOS subunit MIC26 [Cytospora mali]|uniref:MICOS complex subunit n=1 Tax=Cytospora mali TaxID=578113 RepID=A0A194VF40_CYTMA|nr:MICOS subunit MIC26 [Valsa mali var. pyri (nom. inval.)]